MSELIVEHSDSMLSINVIIRRALSLKGRQMEFFRTGEMSNDNLGYRHYPVIIIVQGIHYWTAGIGGAVGLD